MSPRLRHPLIVPARLGKQAIIYSRQSTIEQVRENWGSTALQLDQRQLARDFGWADELINVIDHDLGRSGTGTKHRPGWNEMLRLIAAGSVSAVFVLVVSRLSRELRDFADLLALCRLYDVAMVVDGRPSNPRDPDDTVVLQIQAALAQHDNHSRARMLGRARREKAKQGCVVSRLPVGWVETADGKYDFDPAVSGVIREVIATFWKMGSVLATVRELNRLGVLLPRKRGRRIEWNPPTLGVVRDFLVNPGYAGDYVYGRSEGRPELGMMKSGYPVRKPVPEDRWIRVVDHHPAYLTKADQERIKEILKSNRFECRRRPRNGEALTQGLLRCKRCGVSLSVQYARSGEPRFHCQKKLTTYGMKKCMEFGGHFVDSAVERLFLKAVGAPSADALRAEIEKSRTAEKSHTQYVESELRRLRDAETTASVRYHACDPKNRTVAAVLETEWNDALLARVKFEQNVANELPAAKSLVTQDELDELQALAANVPEIWKHPTVTNADRKKLLRCLIERIEVDRTDDTIEATIHWRSGEVEPFRVWLRSGMHRLIRERHDEGMTVPEIHAWLAAGHPVTGQSWPLTRTRIYGLLKASGLRPNPPKRKGRS